MAAVQLVLWLQNRGRDAGRRLSYYGISVVPITVRFRCRAVRQGRGSKDAVGPPIKWSRLRGCACSRYTSFDNISREFGRIERTLFTLDWLLDKDLHQRVTAGLNKGELKDSLAKAVCFNRLGELRDRSFEAQRHRASGLNLVVGAIILWNTVYLERAIGALRTRAASRRKLTQTCGAGPLEPHQPHRRLLLAAEQTRREGRFPATPDSA
jgi:Tn3 transposase DDE domain